MREFLSTLLFLPEYLKFELMEVHNASNLVLC